MTTEFRNKELAEITQDLMVKVGMSDGCVVVCDRCAMELVLIHTAFINCDYGDESDRQHTLSLMEGGGVDTTGAVLGLTEYGRKKGDPAVLCGHCVGRVTNDFADDYLKAEIAMGWPIEWGEIRK